MSAPDTPTESGFLFILSCFPLQHSRAVSLALKWPKGGALLTALYFGPVCRNNLLFPTLGAARTRGIASINPPLLVWETFHTDGRYFIPGPMNPIRFPLFRNSQEATLNCLLIRPLWHDRNCCVCTHAHARTGAHIYMYTQGRAYKHTHTLLSTLLIC